MNEEECLFLALSHCVAEYMPFASLRSCLLPTFFYCLMHFFLLYIITT